MTRRPGHRGRLKTLKPQLGTMPPRLAPGGDHTYEQRRGSAVDRLYYRKWNREAKRFKTEHPLCLGCEAVGRVTATEVTDHVVPHRGDRDLFWDRSRWQSACRWHHDVVKERLEHMYERGEISTDELWLDSPTARRITLELRNAQQN